MTGPKITTDHDDLGCAAAESVVPVADPPQPEAAQPDTSARRLAPRIVTAWRLVLSLVLAGPVLIVTVIALVVLGLTGLAVVGVALTAAVALVVVYPRARYNRWRWQLSPQALELRHGLLVLHQQALPYFRIQQIDIHRGPLDRLLGLATLQVTTASASGSVYIPGVAADDAPGVRATLLARTALAVGDHPDELSDAV